jgi:acetyl-CoA/propionyl-CoA carboxylase biotin carboxyl carrier protein
MATNVGFLRALLADDDVQAGRLDTGLVERRLDDLVAGTVPAEVVAASFLHRLTPDRPPSDPWELRTGWSPAGARRLTATVDVRGHPSLVVTGVQRDDGRWQLTMAPATDADGRPTDADAPRGDDGVSCVARIQRTGPTSVRLDLDGRSTAFTVAAAPDGTCWLGTGGRTWPTRVEEPWQAHAGDRHLPGHGPVVAPMPGSLTAVLVAEGDAVVEGQALAVVEAMKMEFTLRAPGEGIVVEVHGAPGRQVALGEAIVTVGPVDPSPEG